MWGTFPTCLDSPDSIHHSFSNLRQARPTLAPAWKQLSDSRCSLREQNVWFAERTTTIIARTMLINRPPRPRQNGNGLTVPRGSTPINWLPTQVVVYFVPSTVSVSTLQGTAIRKAPCEPALSPLILA